MNLVTAVVVENAFALARKDEEQQARVKQAQKRRVPSPAVLWL